MFGVGRHTSVDIFSLPRRSSESTELGCLRLYVAIGINRLPDGEGSINVAWYCESHRQADRETDECLRVMEVKDWVKRRVVNHRHVPSTAHQTMYLVMDRFQAIVISAITGRNPGFITEIGVVGVRREKIVQAIAER